MRTRAVLTFILLFAFASAAALAQGLPDSKRHDFPPVGRYRVLVGDFHMHTLNSDGRPTTRERVEESYRLGYDVIAVTDHGKTRAYRVANFVGGALGMIVIRGVETGVNGNEHMNAIGVSGDYVPVNAHRWSKQPGADTIYYRDAMKQVADSGGFLIYNHPHCGYHELVDWGIQQGVLIGIEVKNDVVGDRWNTSEWNGIYCYPEAFDFALKNNLALFANTDVHGVRSPDPAKTLLLVGERSPKGVMDAIRARRTAAWFQGVLWGREDLLSDLIGASVSASRAGDGKLLLANNSPVPLKARVDGTAGAVELPPYQNAAVNAPGAGTSVGITWENVWTDPRTNLRTTVRVKK